LSAQGGSPLGCPELARPDQAPSNPYDRRLLRLAFLAPDLQRGILSGAHPRQLNLERLMQIRIPTSWAAQRALFGSA
jgi:hypothetical protein